MTSRSKNEERRRERDGEKEKRCTGCDSWLPLSSFYKHSACYWGVMNECRSCYNARERSKYIPKPPRPKERPCPAGCGAILKTGERCRPCRNAAEARRRAADPEARKRAAAKTKAWREANPGRAEAANREWRQRNAEHLTEYHRKWRADNPEKVRAKIQKRRAHLRSAVADLTSAEWEAQVASQGGRCHWCGSSIADGFHMDHVMPLARGGLHTAANVVASCAECNLSKGARHPFEWIASLVEG